MPASARTGTARPLSCAAGTALAWPAAMRIPAIVKRAPPFVLCALLAVAAYFQAYATMHPRPWALGGAVAVTRVTFEDDGQHYLVHAHVTNDRVHGVYVYTMQRHYDFDEATGVLTVAMRAFPLLLPPHIKMLSCHTMFSPMQRIAPSKSADLTVKLPRTLRKTGEGGWKEVPFVPDHVRVELAWSDAPITSGKIDPSLCNYDAEVAMQGLERGVVTQTSQ
jgi:hypothetical protein